MADGMDEDDNGMPRGIDYDWRRAVITRTRGRNTVTLLPNGVAVIEPGAEPHEIAKVMADMETAAATMEDDDKYRVVKLLTALIKDLYSDRPQAHVRIEKMAGPSPVTLITLTRILYEQDNPFNDDPPNLELF